MNEPGKEIEAIVKQFKWPPENIPGTFDWWWSGKNWYCYLDASDRFGTKIPVVSGGGTTQIAAFKDAMKEAEKLAKKLIAKEQS